MVKSLTQTLPFKCTTDQKRGTFLPLPAEHEVQALWRSVPFLHPRKLIQIRRTLAMGHCIFWGKCTPEVKPHFGTPSVNPAKFKIMVWPMNPENFIRMHKGCTPAWHLDFQISQPSPTPAPMGWNMTQRSRPLVDSYMHFTPIGAMCQPQNYPWIT